MKSKIIGFVSFALFVVAILLFFVYVLFSSPQVYGDPLPPSEPPPMPAATATTNDAGEIRVAAPEGVTATLKASPVYAWELSFELSPDPAFTNATAYPITVRVPFEATNGFIRVNATKIDLRK